MHDTNLLNLITEDLAPAQQLLELLQEEFIALHGRKMRQLERILADKQTLIILLEQHGRKRSEILASLGLPTNHDGLAQLASHSSIGTHLLNQSVELKQRLDACLQANADNGQSIQLQQATTANQLRILHGGDTPSLYTAQGATAPLYKRANLSQA